MYAYVEDDPLNSIVPFGLKVIYGTKVVPPNQAVQEILNRIDELNGSKDVVVDSGKRAPEVTRKLLEPFQTVGI